MPSTEMKYWQTWTQEKIHIDSSDQRFHQIFSRNVASVIPKLKWGSELGLPYSFIGKAGCYT